jgi:hypothetical protein
LRHPAARKQRSVSFITSIAVGWLDLFLRLIYLGARSS